MKDTTDTSFIQSMKDELSRLQDEYHRVYDSRMIADRFGGNVDFYEKELKLCNSRQKAVQRLLKAYGVVN